MKKTALVILLLVAAAFSAGCTAGKAAGEDIAQGPVRAHFEHHGDWSLGPGCFEKVTGYAYNAGDSPVEGVMLCFNLVDIRSGTIRDSRPVYLGSLGAGQSLTFETALDGECTQDYRVDGMIIR